MLSLLVAILAGLLGSGWLTLVAVVIGAACLAIVAPFDAPTPRERTRVVLACAAYVAAVAGAVVLAHRVEAPTLAMLALVVLILCGVSLTCWALATRKRRRIPASRRYYDT